jgi:ubiquinone biosynthesis protein UbiJ
MTDQEKKIQRAQLQVELDDARDDLAHLREKAIRLANKIEQVCQLLRRNASREPSAADFTAEADMANRLQPEHQSALDHSEIVKLIDELKVTRQKVFNLSERKAARTYDGNSVKIPID